MLAIDYSDLLHRPSGTVDPENAIQKTEEETWSCLVLQSFPKVLSRWYQIVLAPVAVILYFLILKVSHSDLLDLSLS